MSFLCAPWGPSGIEGDIAKSRAEDGKSTKIHYDKPPADKKHICVIGAGASGLTAIKELTALGHKVTCLEMSVRIGGVYTKSYDSTLLTTSSLLTAFSDYSDGLEDRPRFWSDEEYLSYLDGFAHKFDLYSKITFRTRVEKARRCPKSKKWLLTLRSGVYTWPHRSIFLLGRNHSEKLRTDTRDVLGNHTLHDFYTRCEKSGYENVKRTYDYTYIDHVTGIPTRMRHTEPPADMHNEYAFDGLVVCTGTNTWASLPTFRGQEKFKGRIIHAEDYKKPNVFAGKRVLVVGAGESGSDICNEISHHAAKVAIAVRGKHGHLIPRKQADGRVTDLNTNRVRYSNPYILGDWVGWANQHAKKFVASWDDSKDPEERKILQTIGDLNLSQKTSAFSKFGCKNEGFVTAMVTKGAELHRVAFRLEEDKAIFDDGTEFQCDAIVACTGYRNSFPFFLHPDIEDEIFCEKSGMTYKQLAKSCQNPRLLFKQTIHPSTPDGSLAFHGFARPAFGSIPPCSEMQSRLVAMVVSGHLTLPGTEELKCIAKADCDNWEYRFGYDAKRVKGLVDFQLYCDDMAKQMGSLPPLLSLFFTKPMLWWKVMFSSFTMHQYRFKGPYANPAVAASVFEKQPVGDFLECSITAAFLITSKILSLIGFSEFTPNSAYPNKLECSTPVTLTQLLSRDNMRNLCDY